MKQIIRIDHAEIVEILKSHLSSHGFIVSKVPVLDANGRLEDQDDDSVTTSVYFEAEVFQPSKEEIEWTKNALPTESVSVP